MSSFSSYLERSRGIAQIHLIQHPANKDYSQEVLLVRADGEELQGRISELAIDNNDENQFSVHFKGKKYALRINNLVVDAEEGRFIIPDLVYAAVNKHTEGIYIKGDPPKTAKKEEKKYWDPKKDEVS